MYKPDFFDALKKQRTAEDAADDVRKWLGETELRAYTKNEVVQELGAVLRGLSRASANNKPPSHTAFSSLIFSRTDGRGKVLEDDEDQDEVYVPVDEERREAEVKGESIQGTWLEGDDIEDS